MKLSRDQGKHRYAPTLPFACPEAESARENTRPPENTIANKFKHHILHRHLPAILLVSMELEMGIPNPYSQVTTYVR